MKSDLPDATLLELAYCAGVIDSDGTIGIKRSTYAMRCRGDASQAMYSERVGVRQVEPAAIEVLHRLFGGYRGINDPNAKRGKPLHCWQVSDMRAARCLALIVPYLRIKRAQAENCLSLREVKDASKAWRVQKGRGTVGSLPRPQHFTEQMERHLAIARALNVVGNPTGARASAPRRELEDDHGNEEGTARQGHQADAAEQGAA